MKNISIVKLKPIDRDNWRACANLKVRDDQKDALPENLISIAELNFFPQTRAVAIVNDREEIVGFATFGTPVGESTSKIFRLMVDEKHQGRGYGKAALVEIVRQLFADTNTKEIQVCYHPHKEELKRFYGSVGFAEKEILPSNIRAEGKMLAVLGRGDFESGI